ncbi:rhamnogalacturonan acetylesterase [Microbulbifer salipaludis]|uniref:Rhamnogalacturonan acetylesterase n=1 Tax=Microbulbifer salipaludis TaxID=187980 RepID=A0ABS3E5J4_9GAMM|nr:rhamnogalacturonan acetylesterase [Microbulbifer salipaludis]MBN8430580.1 rhamnogalacturonan acetylesterase [Microbulbifer salipaludis]
MNALGKSIRRGLVASALLCASAVVAAAQQTTTIFMAGDSTMSVKELKDYPETGWGVPFAVFFEDDVRVDNRAMNGRSTRTFIEEGRWAGIMDDLQKDDYVIIQFGHNDESEHKKDRYTTPQQYKANLSRFINDVRGAGAEPILMSPITRRYFDGDNTIKHTHPYAPLVREVAAQEKVEFIEMEVVTREYFQAMGDRDSALRFMHIAPGLHPNYPVGVRDDTHLNHLGAREVAQLVLAELRKRQHPLSERLRTPDPKHLALKY